jgi:benzylsuccinate CoA-transferase BbsE subunit
MPLFGDPLNEEGILNHCRVLDLSDEKGWFCAKLLADLGAEVIRLDIPGQPVPDVYANRGKHSLTMNIQSAEGRALFLRLAKTSDIILETFSPGRMEELGLGYQLLICLNPRMIMVSITPFGQTGPWKNYKTSDLVSSALGGQMSVTGEPDKPPLKPFGPQAYSIASLFAANGVMLALWERNNTGIGQALDISIHECTAGTLDHVLVRYLYSGEVAVRKGSLYWNNSFDIFRCKDGYILLSLYYQWQILVDLLKAEGKAEDLPESAWLNEAYRLEHLDHLREILGKWAGTHEVNELVELGQLMRFPWARLDSIPEVMENPQLIAREYFREIPDSRIGTSRKFPGPPVKMGKSVWQVNPELPEAGEYNRQIYSLELGLSPDEIECLHSQGII